MSDAWGGAWGVSWGDAWGVQPASGPEGFDAPNGIGDFDVEAGATTTGFNTE